MEKLRIHLVAEGETLHPAADLMEVDHLVAEGEIYRPAVDLMELLLNYLVAIEDLRRIHLVVDEAFHCHFG